MSCRQSFQSGFSLIEVMISAFLLSFAILGIAGLQVMGMKGTHQSLMKQQAMALVQNISERIRANNKGLASYEFDSDTFDCNAAVANCSTQDCTPAQIAKVDINNLVCGYGTNSKTSALKITSSSDNAILLNGSLKVECIPSGSSCASRDIRITVGWTERALGDEKVEKRNDSNKSDSLVLTTRIGR